MYIHNLSQNKLYQKPSPIIYIWKNSKAKAQSVFKGLKQSIHRNPADKFSSNLKDNNGT